MLACDICNSIVVSRLTIHGFIDVHYTTPFAQSYRILWLAGLSDGVLKDGITSIVAVDLYDYKFKPHIRISLLNTGVRT